MKRPRISLRAALILLTIVGVGCGLVARWLAQGERQRVARTKLAEQGIGCRFDFDEDETGLMRLNPSAPQWLVDLVGLDALYPVDVDFTQAPNDPAIIRLLHDIKLSGITAYTGIDGDTILEIVAHQTRLKHLRLFGGATDAGLFQLGEMPRLVELRLRGETFTGSGLSRLEAPLREIDIEGPAFGDEGLRHVGRFHHLRGLYLTSNAAADAGVRHLSNLTELRTLYLMLPQVTDAGLQAIRDLRSINDLNVGGPLVGAQDLGWIRGLSEVKNLELACSLTDETLPQLAHLKKLNVLYIEGPVQATGAGMAKLRHMTKIEHLLVPPRLLSDEAMPAIAEMSNLDMLVLNNSSVTDVGLTHLVDMRRLRILLLENTKITDDGLRTLCQMPNLIELNLKGCSITSAGLAHLSALPALKTLALGGPQIDSQALKVLSECKQLENLDLRDCPISDEILPTLLSLPKLQILNVRPDCLSAAAVQQLQAANVTVQTPRD